MRSFITFVLVRACIEGKTVERATIIPSYGARSGRTFDAVLVLPPPASGFHVSQVVLQVPHGIRAIRPVQQLGWNASVLMSKLQSPEPVTVVFQCIATNAREQEEPIKIRFQVDFGCDFGNASESTEWQGQHALWWRTEQRLQPFEHLHTASLGRSVQWFVVPKSEHEQLPGQRLAPYTFVTSDEACSVPTGGTEATGMRWLGVCIPPAAVQHEDGQEQLPLVAELEEQTLADEKRISNLEAENQKLKESMKRVDAETDRSFDGHDRKKHDHSRDHRKGRQHAETEVSQQFGTVGRQTAPARAYSGRHGLLMGGGDGMKHWQQLLKVAVLLAIILVVVAGVAAAVAWALAMLKQGLLRNAKRSLSFESCAHTLLKNNEDVPVLASISEGKASEELTPSHATNLARSAVPVFVQDGPTSSPAVFCTSASDPQLQPVSASSLEPHVFGVGGRSAGVSEPG